MVISFHLMCVGLVLRNILDVVMHYLPLKKTTKYFIKKGSKVYCAFVDASKAFDNILHNGLFVKLLKKKSYLRFVYILTNLYSNLSASVIWNGVIGPVFPMNCGV